MTSSVDRNESEDDAVQDGAIDALVSAARSTRPQGLPHGRYYIAPDSAEPFPASVWGRVEIEAVEEAVARIDARLERVLSEKERSEPDPRTPSVFYVTDEERSSLIEMGGQAVAEMLSEFAREEASPGRDR